jgi:ferredoxin-type protein NapF
MTLRNASRAHWQGSREPSPGSAHVKMGSDKSMRSAVSRMQFLRGQFSGGRAPARPPWAIDEAAFVDGCTRCNECMDRCPTGIIVPGSGGFPVVDFSRGGCSFCGECASRCTPGVLSSAAMERGDIPWGRKARFTKACLSRLGVVCRSCADRCGTGAIRFRPQIGGAFLPTLDGQRCNGCGACQAPCPAGAVEIQ